VEEGKPYDIDHRLSLETNCILINVT